ncbi:MAG: hypothetical protein MJB12_10760 [Firmicutes bacterium]|nr:hypothetical protein [Bacillota bacterium]
MLKQALKKRNLMIIGVLLIAFAMISSWLEPFMKQEDNPFSVIKGIVQLHIRNTKIVEYDKLEIYKQYVTKTQDGNEPIISLMNKNGWLFVEQAGGGYIFEKNGVKDVVSSRQFTRRYRLWNVPKAEFGIYLLKDSAISRNEALTLTLSEIVIEQEPLIGIKDLVSYHWSDHSFVLTEEAKKRILKRDDLHERPFVVVADNHYMYVGIFTSGVWSWIFPNPVIYLVEDRLNKIERAYGPKESINGEDPRDNEVIKQVLEEHGKINQ